jgi:hypothetical protein
MACCVHPALALGDVVACAVVALVATVLLLFLAWPVVLVLVWRPYVLSADRRATRAAHRKEAASAGRVHDERPLGTSHFLLRQLHMKGHERFNYSD